MCSGIPLFSGFSVPLYGLGVVLFDAFAVLITPAQIVLCNGIPLFSGFSVPLYSLGVVLFDAFAPVIAGAQIVLCTGIPLFSGLSVPLYGFGVVLFDAIAVFITPAQIVLCTGIPLFSGLSVPLYGFCVVFCNAFAIVITIPETVLCDTVSRFGRFAPQFYGFGIIAGIVGRLSAFGQHIGLGSQPPLAHRPKLDGQQILHLVVLDRLHPLQPVVGTVETDGFQFVTPLAQTDDGVASGADGAQLLAEFQYPAGQVGLDMEQRAALLLHGCASRPLQQRLDAFAHHLVDRDLEQLFEHHLRELMLPQARFQRVGNIGRKPCERAVGVDGDEVAVVLQGVFDFAPHPVVGVRAAVEGMGREDDHEDRCGVDRLHDAAVENTVFQFVEIQKDAVTAQFQFRFERSRQLLAAVAAIADEDVVGHDDEWCYRFQN